MTSACFQNCTRTCILTFICGSRNNITFYSTRNQHLHLLNWRAIAFFIFLSDWTLHLHSQSGYVYLIKIVFTVASWKGFYLYSCTKLITILVVGIAKVFLLKIMIKLIRLFLFVPILYNSTGTVFEQGFKFPQKDSIYNIDFTHYIYFWLIVLIYIFHEL